MTKTKMIAMHGFKGGSVDNLANKQDKSTEVLVFRLSTASFRTLMVALN